MAIRRAIAGDVNVQSVNDAESMKHLQVSPMLLPVILLFFAEIIRGEQTAREVVRPHSSRRGDRFEGIGVQRADRSR